MLPLFFVVFMSLFFVPAAVNFGHLCVARDHPRDGHRRLACRRAAIKAGVRERFGEDETKGIAWYALTRAWQMRRLRLPKPQVKPGDSI